MNETLSAWSGFNGAMVGATAALAGLVIVAASVNIADIVKAPSLTARLAAAIAGLLLALVASAVGLMPAVSLHGYGIAVIVAAVIAAVFPTQAARRIFENRAPTNRMPALKAAVGFATPVLNLVGGVLLVTGSADGLPLLAGGAIVAIIAALLVSWVVLVEVLR